MASEYGRNFRAPKVDIHAFSMIPRADIPRSTFRMQHQHKTTFPASYLIPVYLQEVLPGDAFNVSMTSFVRLSTPLYPLMDNMDLESFFFFVPNRLVWTNWYKFMGEQDNPADSISFTIPQVVSPVNGFNPITVFDYFGLPTTGQVVAGNTVSVSALPLRAYNLIVNQWFRDENLVNSLVFGSAGGVGYAAMDNGPDLVTNYSLFQVAKRHDYFTSCLPWTQKGGVAVTLPLGTSATVKTSATDLVTGTSLNPMRMRNASTGVYPAANLSFVTGSAASGQMEIGNPASSSQSNTGLYPGNLYADLSTATAATINSIRLAFQTQRLLERDARGGTRYTEIIRAHFGVMSPDARLQRPEYLGGGKTPVNVSPVPQTTATGLTGGSSPLGTLSAVGTASASHGFRQSFTEHGHIIGLVCVRADPVYQQGIRRIWSRSTRYDHYMPVFAMLGEQAVLNKEIYADGSANDALTFGYTERWGEYRYHPSLVTGAFNSKFSAPLDAWHLAEKFTALPALNSAFINDKTGLTLYRNLAAGSAGANYEFLADFFFDERAARPMPTYSVPGMVDHF